ncbi:MAG TPA: wax ester/triacylglycerol synthase family O-acyltransferase [Mycobacteriales bacterium]|jgi:WS/DGAT/MGAT family acyltransferase
MDGAQIPDLLGTGRLWLIRVELSDHPGALAALAVQLADHGCNLLALSVLPVPSPPGTGHPLVIDDLVLRVPPALGRDQLAALIDNAGGRCVGVVPAGVEELLDMQTAALRAATQTVTDENRLADALRRLLSADSVRPVTAAGPRGGRPAPIRLERNGHCAVITDRAGHSLLATRQWGPFTDVELARVPALLDLLAAAHRVEDASAPEVPAARRRLSALDVQFLNAESRTAPTHVGVLIMLDPATAPGGQVTVESLRALLAARLHLVPALRWRLHLVPFGLGLPYWIDVATPDLDDHVTEVRVAAPGDEVQLGEAVARLAQEPLERDVPLWQIYLLHGLAGGHQAVYAKVHHAVVDGVSGADVLGVLFDLDPQPRDVPPPRQAPRPEREPGPAEMLRQTLTHSSGQALSLARAARSAAVPDLARLAATSRLHRAPATPFNDPLTARRAFAFISLPLAEIKLVRDALELTLNDVALALCTGVLRRWLHDQGTLPARPLVAAIPVSVRSPEQIGTAGNQISLMLTDLPTHIGDPADRIDALRTAVRDAKSRFAQRPPRLLHHAAAAIPQLLHGTATRLLVRAARLAPPLCNLLVSNVPGPQVPLYAAGARVTATYPVSVISDISGGVNITVMSYNGHIDIGIITCPDIAADPWTLAEHFTTALAELSGVAKSGNSTDGSAPEAAPMSRAVPAGSRPRA